MYEYKNLLKYGNASEMYIRIFSFYLRNIHLKKNFKRKMPFFTFDYLRLQKIFFKRNHFLGFKNHAIRFIKRGRTYLENKQTNQN